MRQGSPAPYGAAAGAAAIVLFAADGAFAADGVLGVYPPVAAVAGWILIASTFLALDRVDRPREPR